MKLHRRITDEPITSDLIAHKGWVSKDFNGSKGIVLCLPDPFFLEVYHLEKRLKKQSQNATRNTKAIITAKNTQTKMQAKMEQLSRAFWRTFWGTLSGALLREGPLSGALLVVFFPLRGRAPGPGKKSRTFGRVFFSACFLQKKQT